jgi:hypothetical protein
MSLESDADRLSYLQAFGEQITVNTQTLWAVPDNAYIDVLDIAAGTRPQAIVRTADVPSIASGQTVVMQGTQYSVAEIQPDGTGMTTLILQKT